MEKFHPYDGLAWDEHAQHLAQFHTHEPRNTIREDTCIHEPSIDAETIPIDDLGKNNLSPASSPKTLLKKYRNVGYTVFSLTEHEYYVERSKYKDVPYEEMPERLEQTSWPWAKWDVDPAEFGVVALPGTELRASYHGSLHDVIGLDTDIGHGRQASITALLDRIADQDGLAILPHPSKYNDASDYEQYVPVFEAADVLLGMEIFNGNDRYPSRALWDRLLTHFGPDRPIWAFAGDDYHGRARPQDGKRFNRSRNVLLLSTHSKAAVREALTTGQFYVQHNGDHHAPFIHAIDVTDDAISVDAPDAVRIEWIADGEVVATGETIPNDRFVDRTYVRAEVHGDGRAVSCTQPFYPV
ncbi:hypothetical protein ATJ93_3703 [Halopiger aswanensis]|uniref:PHP domain-containing protein n=2 Tax=Halopiger aswanensis TaxID=148449 RepID=A0A3R7FT87_9EURY|nr:hypothetical protein ATJ93_3703 [Halopiger aswanensis]